MEPIVHFKDHKGAITFIIMITLLLCTSYYIGNKDGQDKGTFDLCQQMGGTLYYVDTIEFEGIQCLNGSVKDTFEVLGPNLGGIIYGD